MPEMTCSSIVLAWNYARLRRRFLVELGCATLLGLGAAVLAALRIRAGRGGVWTLELEAAFVIAWGYAAAILRSFLRLRQVGARSRSLKQGASEAECAPSDTAGEVMVHLAAAVRALESLSKADWQAVRTEFKKATNWTKADNDLALSRAFKRFADHSGIGSLALLMRERRKALDAPFLSKRFPFEPPFSEFQAADAAVSGLLLSSWMPEKDFQALTAPFQRVRLVERYRQALGSTPAPGM